MMLPLPLSKDEVLASLGRDPRIVLREEERGGVLLIFDVVSRPGDIIEVCAEGAWHFVAGIENSAYRHCSAFPAIVMREYAPAIKRARERAYVQSFIDRLWPRDEGAAQ